LAAEGSQARNAQVFLVYQAWETSTSASPTINLQICNVSSVNYAGGNTGTIRIDILKH
jgi:hypothetical protein